MVEEAGYKARVIDIIKVVREPFSPKLLAYALLQLLHKENQSCWRIFAREDYATIWNYIVSC